MSYLYHNLPLSSLSLFMFLFKVITISILYSEYEEKIKKESSQNAIKRHEYRFLKWFEVYVSFVQLLFFIRLDYHNTSLFHLYSFA